MIFIIFILMSTVGYTKDFLAMIDVNMVTSPIALIRLNVFPSNLKHIYIFFKFSKKSEY